MNEAHLHLAVNHFPIITPFIGLLILAGGYFYKAPALIRAAYVLFILSAVFTLIAMLTGEGAEEIVENIDGVSHDYIEVHEESAELFSTFSYVLGIISLVALWCDLKNKSYQKYILLVVVGWAAITLYVAKLTGTSGGEIRHTEIRSNMSLIDNHSGEAEEGEHEEKRKEEDEHDEH
jgi:uncharacterized membrane protein